MKRLLFPSLCLAACGLVVLAASLSIPYPATAEDASWGEIKAGMLGLPAAKIGQRTYVALLKNPNDSRPSPARGILISTVHVDFNDDDEVEVASRLLLIDPEFGGIEVAITAELGCGSDTFWLEFGKDTVSHGDIVILGDLNAYTSEDPISACDGVKVFIGEGDNKELILTGEYRRGHHRKSLFYGESR